MMIDIDITDNIGVYANLRSYLFLVVVIYSTLS